MTTPAPTSEISQPKNSSFARRFVAALVLCLVVFGLLWYTVFSAVTAALVSAGVTGVLVIGSSTSDVFDTILDMLADMVLGILAAIGAFFAAIFSIFR
jgi:hypothetical protein